MLESAPADRNVRCTPRWAVRGGIGTVRIRSRFGTKSASGWEAIDFHDTLIARTQRRSDAGTGRSVRLKCLVIFDGRPPTASWLTSRPMGLTNGQSRCIRRSVRALALWIERCVRAACTGQWPHRRPCRQAVESSLQQEMHMSSLRSRVLGGQQAPANRSRPPHSSPRLGGDAPPAALHTAVRAVTAARQALHRLASAAVSPARRTPHTQRTHRMGPSVLPPARSALHRGRRSSATRTIDAWVVALVSRIGGAAYQVASRALALAGQDMYSGPSHDDPVRHRLFDSVHCTAATWATDNRDARLSADPYEGVRGHRMLRIHPHPGRRRAGPSVAGLHPHPKRTGAGSVDLVHAPETDRGGQSELRRASVNLDLGPMAELGPSQTGTT